jgi:hypothetical protein
MNLSSQIESCVTTDGPIEFKNYLSFKTSDEPTRKHYLEQSVVILPLSREYLYCYSLPRKPVFIRANALTFASVSVAAETLASEPLSGNGLLRLSGVMSRYTFKKSRFLNH